MTDQLQNLSISDDSAAAESEQNIIINDSHEDSGNDTKSSELENFIEPADEANELSEFGQNELIDEIFRRTKTQVSPNDPIVQLFLYMNAKHEELQDNHKFFLMNQNRAAILELQQKYAAAENDLLDKIRSQIGDNLDQLTTEQKQITAAFDQQMQELQTLFKARIDELSKLLSALDKAKDNIVSDVWSKMHNLIDEQMKKQLEELAKNSNTKLNKQNHMMIGAGGGFLIGFVLMLLVMMIR